MLPSDALSTTSHQTGYEEFSHPTNSQLMEDSHIIQAKRNILNKSSFQALLASKEHSVLHGIHLELMQPLFQALLSLARNSFSCPLLKQ